MMLKMSCILLFVAAVFVLVAGDCIREIQEIERKIGNKTIMGGYHRIKDPENDAVVRKIVADSIELYNKAAEDADLYKDNDHYVAYSQLVNGQNYCCSFQMISYACKDGRTGGYCDDKIKNNCSVKAYKAFEDTYATLTQGTLHCLLAPKA